MIISNHNVHCVSRSMDDTSLSKRRLREENDLHAQMEILINMLDNELRDLVPLAGLLIMAVIVSCNVMVVKADGRAVGSHFSLYMVMMVGYPCVLSWAAVAFLRVAGSLQKNSIDLLRSVQLRTMRSRGTINAQLRGKRHAALIGRRKPLGIHFGRFGVLEDVYDVSYALSILDNTVSGVFMVDASARMYLMSQV